MVLTLHEFYYGKSQHVCISTGLGVAQADCHRRQPLLPRASAITVWREVFELWWKRVWERDILSGCESLLLVIPDYQNMDIILEASALNSFGVAGLLIARILHSAVASHLSAYAHKFLAFTCLSFKEPSRACELQCGCLRKGRVGLGEVLSAQSGKHEGECENGIRWEWTGSRTDPS